MKLIHSDEKDGLTQKTWAIERGNFPDLDRKLRRLRWMRRLCLLIGHDWGIGHVNGMYGPLPFWGQCRRCLYAETASMDAAFDVAKIATSKWDLPDATNTSMRLGAGRARRTAEAGGLEPPSLSTTCFRDRPLTIRARFQRSRQGSNLRG